MTDHEYMKLSLDMARATRGQTSPNPMVGAVVVKDGAIVGMGAHLKAGEGHAEVQALRMAGDKAEGATAYVTLEPCSHYGKTPPCSDLLIEKKVSRVVVASLDSNPLVAGTGVQRLRDAGIQVDIGILEQEARELNKMFFHYMSTHKPYVTIKTAMSLDGKIATVTGESKWITGEPARADVHQYRHEHDAILVGVNTVIADNPSLTTRLPGGGRNPVRVILDTHLRTPLSSRVVTDGEAPTWIMTGAHVSLEKRKQYEEYNVSIVSLDSDIIMIDSLLTTLGEKGILSLFVEGGQQINASFLQGKHFNELITYVSPKLIGGTSAPTIFGGSGFSSLEDALPLSVQSIEKIGEDIKIVSVLRKEV